MNMTIIRKPIVIISIAAALCLLIASVTVSIRIKNLNRQVADARRMLLSMREASARLEKDKEAMGKENEKLQADTVAYLNLNTKLQAEKEDLVKSVEDAQKVIENKEGVLQRAENRLREVEKAISSKGSKEQNALIKEKKALTKKTISLNAMLKKERALYHYNLGVAYAGAKLYDDALAEYKKSLVESPDNAEAHYNLALIYDTVNGDSESAIYHYGKYLVLKPDAEDREDVEASIGRLK